MAKTQNFSVRFDEDDYNLICKRQGFTKPQQVVNFLLSEYCKLYRVEKQSIFQETPTKLISEETITSKEVSPVGTKDSYINRLKKTTTITEVEIIVKEAKEDTNLLPSQKLGIEQFAKEHSSDFYND